MISQYTRVMKCVRCKDMDLFRMQWATEREGSIWMSRGKASGRASQKKRLLSWGLEC